MGDSGDNLGLLDCYLLQYEFEVMSNFYAELADGYDQPEGAE
jgi:hypothetical protein